MDEDPVVRCLASEPPLWTDDERLVCRRVVDETPDVKSFWFTGQAPRRFAFRPGQYLTFAFEIDGEPVSRCYTLSSAPTRPHAVSITVKRGGPVSRWLHDAMRPGAEVHAAGPLGAFSTFHHPARKYLFLSGGSGITPLMSMARAYCDLGEAADIVFVHGARTPNDIIFRRELEEMTRTLPGFRLVAICEEDGAQEVWGGFRGRLSLEMLRLIAPDFAEREVFTCGPTLFMDCVKGLLADGGFDFTHYHEESFLLDAAPIEAPAAAAGEGFRIELTKSGRTIDCGAQTFILSATQAAGLRLPFSCAQGLCGTCKSRLVSGRVDMKHAGGIRQREIDQGLILLCCSRPLTDLVIER